MFEKPLTHSIQCAIVDYLMTHEYARFSELRPPTVDTNLFTYHLKLLQKSDYIKKIEQGYTLSRKGLRFADNVMVGSNDAILVQPKVITMILVQDGYGKILLQKMAKQPYINTWTLPYGKMNIDDRSVLAAAQREIDAMLPREIRNLRHVGDCYIRVMHGEDVESTMLAHIVRCETDDLSTTDNLQWVKPLDLGKVKLAPAVEQIVARSFFGDDFFFEEFTA